MRPSLADPTATPGDRSGEPPLVVYFHGAPGSPREIGLIVGAARQCGISPISLHRARIAPGLTGAAYFDLLAMELRTRAAGRQVDVIGFSIGAFVALEVCRRLGDQVRGVDLIAPAGPLELMETLDDVAGAAVFGLARRAPWLFRTASRLQGLLAVVRPDLLMSMLFAKAAGDDRDLAKDRTFKTLLGSVLRDALGHGLAGYVRDVEAYVRPWAEALDEVRAPVRIWQGALDNWAPPRMAKTLAERLVAAEPVSFLPGRSHYSALIAAAPDIFRRLSASAASNPTVGGD